MRMSLQSLRQHYESYFGTKDKFDELLDHLARIEQNLFEVESRVQSTPPDRDEGIALRQLPAANKRMKGAAEILDNVAEAPFLSNSGSSPLRCVHRSK